MQSHGSQDWLITFADLISLLLTFFVMIFAMSTVEGERWDAVVRALSQWFTPFEYVDDAQSITGKSVDTFDPARAVQLDYLALVLENRFGNNRLVMIDGVQRLEDRLVISLPSALLFGGEGAVLARPARQALANIGETLRNVGNAILVIGHTSPGPAADAPERSSWALSLTRSAAIATELRRAGYLRDIPIFGTNAMQIEHLSPEIDDDQRGLWIERVDIVIRESKEF
jgi:chemotaxis protein MotB